MRLTLKAVDLEFDVFELHEDLEDFEPTIKRDDY